MRLINVRALPDRVAFTAPKNGKPIPSDRFIAVQETPWIRRLIDVHGDIEVQPATVHSLPTPKRQKSTD
jgi:hypothetical protein